MAINLNPRGGFLQWRIAVPAWLVLLALLLVPVLLLFVYVATADAENSIPLSRNEVVMDAAGNRIWRGTLLNPSDSEFRELAVTVRFLDANDQPVGEATGQSERLGPGDSLALEATLPQTAVRMHIYSLQWRTGRRNVGRLLGPYRPWEFGYLQYDPAQ